MKLIKLSTLTILLVLQGFSGSAQVRQIRNMDSDWKFTTGDPAGAEKPVFNDKSWRTLDVPHDWSIESEFKEDVPFGHRVGYLPNGIGWYRKTVMFSKKELEGKVRIEFDGVYMNSDVWINGVHLGHYPNGHVSFSYELTPHLKAGPNTIAVRADNSLQPNSRWYNGSGIYRHVRLVLTNKLQIPEYGIYITTPVATEEKATVKVSVKLENNFSDLKNVTIFSYLINPKGLTVAESEDAITIKPNSTSGITRELNVSNPVLWSLETPELYTLKTYIKEKGKTIDDVSTVFGIRNIEYDADRGFLLNGKQVKMNGVNLHHDGGPVGTAVPEAVWIRRLKILKDMGCNAIRTSHNPVAPEFLDICDSLGFLVMDEVFDEWKLIKGPKGNEVTQGYHVYFDEWATHDLANTIRRDRNHPSVVLWSVGNEVPDQGDPEGHKTLKKLMDVCTAEDPTRPTTQGCDLIVAQGMKSTTSEFLNTLDIVGYNYVDRWGNRKELYFSEDKQNNPDWKMIGTESSSVRGASVRREYSLGTDPERVSPNYNTGMINASQLWKFVATRDYVIGDFMWTGIDYFGEASWPNVGSSTGPLDRCAFPKDGFYFYQSLWTEKPMVHLLPHWNWEGREGQFIPVLCYTNCDAVELFLNGKSIGQKRIEFPRMGYVGNYGRSANPTVNPTTADLHLSWDVPYEPGTIKAVGMKEGKVVCTEEIKTAGASYAIRLSTDKNLIKNEPWDVAHIKVEILDNNGNIVPNAGDLVEFTVNGPGKIIGVDNGNPRDHASFKINQRNAFNGICLAMVQATSKSGVITITAKSANLKENSISVSIIP